MSQIKKEIPNIKIEEDQKSKSGNDRGQCMSSWGSIMGTQIARKANGEIHRESEERFSGEGSDQTSARGVGIQKSTR